MSQVAEHRTGNFLTRLVADTKVRTKILASSVVVIVITMLVGLLCVQRMSDLSAQMEDMKNEQVEGMNQIATMRQGIGGMFRGMLLFSFYTDAAAKSDAVEEAKAADKVVDDAFAGYSALNVGTNASAERTEAVEAFGAGWELYKNLRNVNFFGEAAPTGFTLPADVLAAYGEAEKAMTDGLNQMQSVEVADSDHAAVEGQATYESAVPS